MRSPWLCRTRLLGILVLASACLLRAPDAIAGGPQSGNGATTPNTAPQELVITAKAIKIVPPATEASASFSLINTGRAPITLALELGDLMDGDTPLPGAVSLGPGVPDVLRPGQRWSIPVTVAGMSVSASATVAVVNGATRIGDLIVVRYPVAVTVDEIKPGGTVATRAGSPIRVTLRNSDRNDYAVNVGMSVGPYQFCETKPESTRRSPFLCALQLLRVTDAPVCAPSPVIVPAAGAAIVSLDPPCAVSSGVLSGLIKDEEHDGTVTVALQDPASSPGRVVARPVAQVPFKAVVGYAYLGPVGQQVWSTVLIAVVLALGGLCSLVSRHWVPNELARRQLLEDLNRIDTNTTTVSGRVGSELSVLMRVESKRLKDQVRQVSPIRADSEALLAEYRSRMGNLAQRVDHLRMLDDASDRLAQVRSTCAPPTEVHEVEDRLDRLTHTLRKASLTNLEAEKLQVELSSVLADVDAIGSRDEARREALKTRIADRLTTLRPEDSLWTTDVAQQLRAVLPGPFGLLTGPVDGESWTDAQVQALTTLRDYIRLYEASADPGIRQRLADRQPLLVRHLSAPSIESLRFAGQLVREMREGIFDADIVAALQRGEFRIQTEPRTFQPFQLFRLHLRFDRDELNGTAALMRFRCVWHFPDEEASLGSAQRGEEGWSICHYLTAAQTSRVSVSIHRSEHQLDGASPAAADAAVPVSQPVATLEATLTPMVSVTDGQANRMRAELIGLGVVLLIALLGLVTGAREQITKLDIVPGMIAVFLLGFSADSIKGLLTARTAPAEGKVS